MDEKQTLYLIRLIDFYEMRKEEIEEYLTKYCEEQDKDYAYNLGYREALENVIFDLDKLLKGEF